MVIQGLLMHLEVRLTAAVEPATATRVPVLFSVVSHLEVPHRSVDLAAPPLAAPQMQRLSLHARAKKGPGRLLLAVTLRGCLLLEVFPILWLGRRRLSTLNGLV